MSGKLPNLNESEFRTDIETSGGKIYFVGGVVRDYLLGKDSKDIDILVTGIPMDMLEIILSKYGRVDAVGKSFGVLKFGKYDFTIPRTERPNGAGGYQGFDVVSDHELPLEKDLERRDFTINAIAMDVEGNIIDPFNGGSDINNRQIRMVNEQAFNDDPLRMLRAVQFASRFNFNIEKKTFWCIKENAQRISEISPERILIELDKIVRKGDCEIGSELLYQTRLLQHITKEDQRYWKIFSDEGTWRKIKTLGEFIFSLLHQQMDNPADFFKDTLKGDLDTYREIKAYEIAYTGFSNSNPYKKRIFQMYKLHPESINSKVLFDELQEMVFYMKYKNMPFSLKDLKIDGNDLLQLGFVGKEIGDLMVKMVDTIYIELLTNDREALLKYAKLWQTKKQLI